MTLDEFVWLEIGASLGLAFALAMLLWHRPTQRKWLSVLSHRIRQEGNEHEG